MKGYAPSSAPSRKASKRANGEGHRSFVGGACVEGEKTNRKADDWCGEEPVLQDCSTAASDLRPSASIVTVRPEKSAREGDVQTRRGRTVEEIMNQP